MENNELQKIWRDLDSKVMLKSKAELDLLLTSKAKQTINKFLSIIIISIIICIGVLAFLIITMINRKEDLIYLINNFSLGMVTVIALLSGLLSWHKLQDNKYDQSLKNWLEDRISLLSAGATGQLHLFLIPFIYILMVLSVHVYFENKPFLEVLSEQESIISILIAAPIGIFVSYFAARKIRKFKRSNLEFLKDLYIRVCNES
jgi:hypothetical protein